MRDDKERPGRAEDGDTFRLLPGGEPQPLLGYLKVQSNQQGLTWIKSVTFSAIPDALRLDFTKSYLGEENLPISEVAWLFELSRGPRIFSRS